MKGVLVEQAGAPFKVVDGIEKPSPARNQVLVKPITIAFNPVLVCQYRYNLINADTSIVAGTLSCKQQAL